MVVHEQQSLQKSVGKLDCEYRRCIRHLEYTLVAAVANCSCSCCSRADQVNIAAAQMALVADFVAAVAAGWTCLLAVACLEMTLRLARMRALYSVVDR